MLELFNQLMDLKEEDGFIRKDVKLDDRVYRIFDYGLVSYQKFKLPSALLSRGTMFDITDLNNPELVCCPLPKFFNYHEGNVNYDDWEIERVSEKLDGSLLSSYLHNGKVKLKTRYSLDNQQIREAEALLYEDCNKHLLKSIDSLSRRYSITVNMEYISPTNRIVVKYNEPSLRILAATKVINDSKDLLFKPSVEFFMIRNIRQELPLVHRRIVDKSLSLKQIIENVRKETVGEGVVISLTKDGKRQLIKVKNDNYVLLHSTKDSFDKSTKALGTDKVLFKLTLNNGLDDVKSLYEDSQYVTDKISFIEENTIRVYNHLNVKIKHFVSENKHLIRKEFSEKAYKELPLVHTILMLAYCDKQYDLKEFMIKNVDKFLPLLNENL